MNEYEKSFRLEKWKEGSGTNGLELFGEECQDRDPFKKTFKSLSDVEKLWFGESMPLYHLPILEKTKKTFVTKVRRVFNFYAKSSTKIFSTPTVGRRNIVQHQSKKIVQFVIRNRIWFSVNFNIDLTWMVFFLLISTNKYRISYNKISR